MLLQKIDYRNVLTKEEINSVTAEELDLIEKVSTFHHNYLSQIYPMEVLTERRVSKSLEISKNSVYKNWSAIAKSLLATNLVYYDTENFIKILIQKGISYSQLYRYSMEISKRKEAALQNNNEELSKSSHTIQATLNKLCSYFFIYYGVTDFNFAINKMNEIVVLHKDLYDKLQKENQKQKIR